MNLLLLTQVDCGLCIQAKEVVDRLAAAYSLSVSTLDINSPAGQELAERCGIWFAPGIVIDGEPVSYGRVSERKLRREIERRVASPAGR